MVFGLVLLFGLGSLLAQPIWLACDAALAVAARADETLDELGVALDPWGSPILDPARPGPSEGRPASLQSVLSQRITEQTKPKAAHVHLAKVCARLAEERRSRDPTSAGLLDVAGAVARANAEDAPEVLKFPRRGPYPYRFASNAMGYYYTQLSAYSLGPNQRDELGFGDDVLCERSALMSDRLKLLRSWAWLLPLTVALVLLGTQLLCFIVPVARSAPREVGFALAGGLLAAGATWALLDEATVGNPSWRTLHQALGLRGDAWEGLGRGPKDGVALLGGGLAALTGLLLRLPHLMDQGRVLTRQDAEREVARLEQALGYGDPQVAKALEWVAELARGDGDTKASEVALARAERIRAAARSELPPEGP